MEARECTKETAHGWCWPHMDGEVVHSPSPMPALFLFNSKTDSDPELGIQVLGQDTQSGTNSDRTMMHFVSALSA